SIRRRLFPQFPWCPPTGKQIIKTLLVLKCVNRPEKPVIFYGHQLFLANQPLEWFADKFLTLPNIVEYLAPESVKPSVDPNIGVIDVRDSGHQIFIADGDKVITQIRLYAKKCSY